MKQNVGTADRVVRVIVGLAVLSVLFMLDGGIRYIGLLGFVPLLTGIVGWCPLYSAFRVSTRRRG